MNQIKNYQTRYSSNTWMGQTRTNGPDEFEPSKFDCILDVTLHAGDLLYILRGIIHQVMLIEPNIRCNIPCRRSALYAERYYISGNYVLIELNLY